MTCHSFRVRVRVATLVSLCLVLFCMRPSVLASPLASYRPVVVVRPRVVQPYFPDTPPSCPICAKGYPSISSCTQAAPALANASAVIFNPGAFIDVIKCSCTDTFQSAFPQCADCFENTNQTAVLNTPNLPSLVNSIRQVCALASTLLGNVSNTDGETTPSVASTPVASSTSSAASRRDLLDSTLLYVITGIAALITLAVHHCSSVDVPI